MNERLFPTPVHGGDLSAASVHFGRPAEGWLDLSTGINPCPYPNIAVSPESLVRLPSSGTLDGLLAAARGTYGIPPEAGLCAAPGTQAILQVLPEIVGRADIAVISPTYGEHAHIWRQAGNSVSEIGTLDRVGDAGVVVIVNPNNPDGRLTQPGKLDDLRADLAATGGLLIVDEAFADVAPDISLASGASQKGLLVLKSFGKFFGLAGLRLGFAAGHTDLIGALAARLGPWAVSGSAIEIGTRALADLDWIEATRTALSISRERLDRILLSHGLELVGGTDLFRLVRCDKSHALFQRLAEAGVLVREFPERPGWLRFGLPGNDADFERLNRSLG
jgi:cobalamin biosynthetic protein CobC